MLNLFKRKESDIHEQEAGVGIREVDEDIQDEDMDEDANIGVLIQFTPVATYLYINKGGFNESSSNGNFELIDEDGNNIDVYGNTISTSIDNMNELSVLIERFKLNHDSIPIVQIEVEEF